MRCSLAFVTPVKVRYSVPQRRFQLLFGRSAPRITRSQLVGADFDDRESAVYSPPAHRAYDRLVCLLKLNGLGAVAHGILLGGWGLAFQSKTLYGQSH